MASKEELKEELRLILEIGVGGCSFGPQTFKELVQKHPINSAVHLCQDGSRDDSSGFYLPDRFYTKNNFQVSPLLNRHGIYHFEADADKAYIKKGHEVVLELELWDHPDFYEKKTSDGIDMKIICNDTGNTRHGRKNLFTAYSNECSLKDKGLDCLFCNINSTKARFAEKENIQWKQPKQIAEVVKAAYDEGYTHFTVTGGFIPERREVDYYLDVAEAVQEELGREYINGTACIGAPKDISIIEKYKEAGWTTIAMNMEVWNENFYNAICPGKVQECGGYSHWLEAIKYAVEVFGKGNVRSNFVGGLEPKEYLLDGIETLSSWGVVTTATTWAPAVGSAFEGHQTPNADWHWEVQNRIVEILKKNGISYEQLSNASNGHWYMHELYAIDEGIVA